jgi:hypothetical protein
VDGGVTVRTLIVRTKRRMKSWHYAVAAVAEVGNVLKGEHLSVWRPVGGVTRDAAFDSAGAVLEDKRTILGGMTVGA